MQVWNTYLEKNKSRFLEELLELLKIPSVSADPEFSDDVYEAAKYVEQQLEKAGVDHAAVCLTEGFPVVYGEKIIDENKPTILVYGHYDVQPADPYELWTSPPFEPVVKDGYIYARGSCDDKGQMYMHLKAFEMMLKTNSLPCNVKFMIEGEEEVGSKNLEKFITENKEKLKADIVLISDTAMLANDVPSVTTGLRGIAYLEVKVTGPNRDLHSGFYGGAVGNPINILCDMVSQLQDKDGKITIPGFYDDVVVVSEKERTEMAKAPFDVENFKKSIQISDIQGETGYSTPERTSIRPSLDVNGIWGGYIGAGSKTVLPSHAQAKVSMRLVPNQDPDKIADLFEEHFKTIAPSSVKVEVIRFHGGKPVVTPLDLPAYKAASKAYETTFNKKPVPQRAGGSIPIVSLFEQELGLKSILMGFGLDTDAIHSPNERFGLFNYYKGIETIPYFYKYFSELKN